MRRGRSPGGPLRLSLVVDWVEVGGAEVLLLNLFREFDPTLVAPQLICFKEPGALGPEFAAAGFPVHVLDRGGPRDPRTVPRLIRRFRQDRTDVVLVTHLQHAPLLLARVAAWLSRLPSVIAPHGMDTLLFGHGRILPERDVRTLFLSDALVLVAPSQGSYLHRHEGVGRRPWSRVREVVIPNGIPLPPVTSAEDRRGARAELALGEEDLVVGIVARLSAVKAHEVLIEAVAKLAPTHPDLRLVCVGDGERESELRAMVRGFGLADRVRFTGLRRDVTRLLPAFDIACLTSRFECAPLAVVEAMAAGVPVVTTDVGAVRDMVSDGVEGFVVPSGDPSSVADRIARLVADRELRLRLGAAGRARAELQFRIEDTAAGYERLLASL